MLETLSHTKLDPNLKDVGYLTPEGKKAIGVIGEVALVTVTGEAVDMTAIGAGGGAGGGSIVYSNSSGDFIATPTVGTKNITITGLPYTLETNSVVSGSIKLIASDGTVTNLPLTDVAVSAGVITLDDMEANFATGDTVQVTLIGPDKAYDETLDSQKVIVQNPEYGHYTSVETLVDEADIAGAQATGDAGGTATTIVDADGAFSVANVAVGYNVRNRTESVTVAVVSVDSATQITTGTVTSWSSDAYTLPLVKRYEINMESYKHLAIHYYLRNGASLNTYLKIYGTLNATANADSDAGWVNMSAAILGAADGINCAASTTLEDLVIIDTPSPVLKYMLKLVVECTLASGQDNDYEIFIKKSS